MTNASKQELGRTVLEMLAVVVVLSLITLSALSGFRQLHERAIHNALQKAIATDITRIIQETQGTAMYAARPLTHLGPYEYPFHSENGTLNSGAKKDYYWITIGANQGNKVKTLSKSLCQRLLNHVDLPIAPVAITINDVPSLPSADACQDDSVGNVLTLYFQKKTVRVVAPISELTDELSQPNCNSDSQCTSPDTCVNGHCVSTQCDNNEFLDIHDQCIPCSDLMRHTTSQESCTSCNNLRIFVNNQYCDPVCPEDYFKDSDGNCVACGTDGDFQAEEAECNKCKTTHPRTLATGNWCDLGGECATGYFKDTTGTCHTCSDTANYPTQQDQCQKCSEIGIDRNFFNNTCYPFCGANGFFSDGICTQCTTGETYATVANGCQACNDNIKYQTSEEACATCGSQRLMMYVASENKTYCVRNCPEDHFRNTNGNCTVCTFATGKATSQEECDKCNLAHYPRYLDANGLCQLSANCPAGQFKDNSGKCQSCADQNVYEVSAQSSCSVCDDTATPRVYEYVNNVRLCYPQGDTNTCTNGFITASGRCASCIEVGKIEVTQEQECTKCSDRIYFEANETKYCGLCDSDQYFRSTWKCVSCEYKFEATEKSCDACPNNRFIGGWCYPPCESGFRGNNAQCYECAEERAVSTTNTECAKCNNREIATIDGSPVCLLTTCPNNYFRDDQGNCLDCNTADPVTTNDCGACSNRDVVNNQCVLGCSTGVSFRVTEPAQYSPAQAGQCALCDTVYADKSTETSCLNCTGQRTWDSTTGRCIWNGAIGYFQNKNLNWTSCDMTTQKEIATTQEAQDLCLSCNQTANKRHIVTNNNGQMFCAAGS